MRYRDLLLEFDLSKTIANFGDRLVARFANERGPIRDALSDTNGNASPEAIVNFLSDCDPSPKKAFLLHLIRWYCDGSMRLLEDAYKAIEPLQLYGRFRNRGLAPLQQITFSQLLDLGDELKGARSQADISRDEEQGFYARGAAKLLRDTASFKIVELASEEAAKFFGRNTRWCTASEKNNMYDHYAEDGSLFVVAFKGQGSKKWQLHFASEQYMDERDEEIDREAFFAEAEIAEYFRSRFPLRDLGMIIRPDDLTEYDQKRAVDEYGPNIEYLEKPTEDTIMMALRDGRTSVDMLPPSAASDARYQIAAIQGNHLSRYFDIENVDSTTTVAFAELVAQRINNTQDTGMVRLFRQMPECLKYAVKHKLVSDVKIEQIWTAQRMILGAAFRT